MSGVRAALAVVLSAQAFAACAGDMRWPYIPTQRPPGPMESVASDLAPGSSGLLLPGPEEVLVVRHADPVQLRPAGELSAFPLRFYDKSRRVTAGSWVHSAPGGRAEIIWPEGDSLVLFGRTTGIVGSPSRGEPLFLFLQVERADISLSREEQIELPGGALLVARSGPFVVERLRGDVLRVTNQSKESGELAFRDRVFGLDPGQGIDVPLLSIGGEPVAPNPGTAIGGEAGFSLEVQGDVQAQAVQHGWRVTAGGGEHEVGALGVRIRLGRDESALMRNLGALSSIPAVGREESGEVFGGEEGELESAPQAPEPALETVVEDSGVGEEPEFDSEDSDGAEADDGVSGGDSGGDSGGAGAGVEASVGGDSDEDEARGGR